MLEPAIKYKAELEELQYETWFNDKYKYWTCDVYHEPISIDENTWNKHQFVSVVNDEVIGYISYNIARQTECANCFNAINFTDNIAVFGVDLGNAIKDIFEKYGFRKLSFSVVIGNPIEKSYDRMIEKYGGRIIGVKKEEVKLIDGKFYDFKMYEILASEYFNGGRK